MVAEPIASLVALQLIPATGIVHEALSEGKGSELFDFFSLEGWPGRMKRGVPAFWAAFSESHVPCGP